MHVCLPHRLIGVSVPKLLFIKDITHLCPSCGCNATTSNFNGQLLDQVEMSGPIISTLMCFVLCSSHFVFLVIFKLSIL